MCANGVQNAGDRAENARWMGTLGLTEAIYPPSASLRICVVGMIGAQQRLQISVAHTPGSWTAAVPSWARSLNHFLVRPFRHNWL